jgi:hypothetical protein
VLLWLVTLFDHYWSRFARLVSIVVVGYIVDHYFSRFITGVFHTVGVGDITDHFCLTSYFQPFKLSCRIALCYDH